MANELQPLSLLFQNRLFRIPDYQRGYAWLQQQLVDFWDDLVNLQTDRYHYTGLLSLKPLKGKETMYRSSITAFHDSYMVTGSILIPVKKDEASWRRNTSSTLPFSLCLKQSHTVRTNRKLWHYFLLNKSCLIRTPADKTGTPFFPTVKSIP